MVTINTGYMHDKENVYIYPILINREIKINDTVSTISDLFVELYSKINIIYQRNLATVFGEKDEFFCIGDLSLIGEVIIEYIGENNSINISKHQILEEEYLKLSFAVKDDDVRGEVISKYIYDKGGGEVYISIYYLLYFNNM